MPWSHFDSPTHAPPTLLLLLLTTVQLGQPLSAPMALTGGSLPPPVVVCCLRRLQYKLWAKLVDGYGMDEADAPPVMQAFAKHALYVRGWRQPCCSRGRQSVRVAACPLAAHSATLGLALRPGHRPRESRCKRSALPHA